MVAFLRESNELSVLLPLESAIRFGVQLIIHVGAQRVEIISALFLGDERADLQRFAVFYVNDCTGTGLS